MNRISILVIAIFSAGACSTSAAQSQVVEDGACPKYALDISAFATRDGHTAESREQVPDCRTAAQSYLHAMEQYEASHFREAVTALREAARAGHVPAAHMLATMLLVGPRLYGEQVTKDVAEGVHWLRQAAASGNEIASFQLSRLAQGH